MEQTGARPGVERRLVLGFDAGCLTCSGLAKRIEEATGEKLETMGLSDPRMIRWRSQALGEDAPWAPTLVEIGGEKVRAWTGIRMGARLARWLGPAATWRVARVLGETRESNRAQHSSHSGLTRSQFLTGLGGAVVGMSVLSGMGSLATPAAAEEHWLSQLSFASSKELSGKQAAEAWVRLARGRHLRRLFSSHALDDNLAASRIRSRMYSATRISVASPPTANIKGVRHQLKGGGQLLALAYQEDDALMVSYRFDKLGQKTRLFSRVIEDESEEFVRTLAEAEDNDVFVAPQGAARQSESVLAVRGRSCRSGTNCGPCYGCRCVSASKRCLFNCCAACAFSCLNLWTCLACVAVWCPVCASVNRCCYRKECRYISGC